MKAQCPHCQAIMTLPKDYVTSEVKCEKCKETFVPIEKKTDTRTNVPPTTSKPVFRIPSWVALSVLILIICALIVIVLEEQPPSLSNITFEEINTIYDKLDLSDCKTSLQRDEKVKRFKGMVESKYYGRLVEWTGQVAGVNRFSGKFYVSFKHTDRSLISDVTVRFPDSEKGNLLILQKGDLVTYRGTIDSISRYGLSNHGLKNGQIIKIQRNQ